MLTIQLQTVGLIISLLSQFSTFSWHQEIGTASRHTAVFMTNKYLLS